MRKYTSIKITQKSVLKISGWIWTQLLAGWMVIYFQESFISGGKWGSSTIIADQLLSWHETSPVMIDGGLLMTNGTLHIITGGPGFCQIFQFRWSISHRVLHNKVFQPLAFHIAIWHVGFTIQIVIGIGNQILSIFYSWGVLAWLDPG